MTWNAEIAAAVNRTVLNAERAAGLEEAGMELWAGEIGLDVDQFKEDHPNDYTVVSHQCMLGLKTQDGDGGDQAGQEADEMVDQCGCHR